MQTYFNLVLSQQKQIDQLNDLVKRLRQKNSKLKQLVGQHIKVEDQQEDSSLQQLSVSQLPEVDNNILEQIFLQSKHNKTDNLNQSSDKVKHCKICNKTYIDKKGYAKHCKRIHQNQQVIKSKITKIDPQEVSYCKICNKTYKDRRGYLKHCRRMHSDKQTKKSNKITINTLMKQS
ncbi:hypothetical protein pb186bvf_000710 [Paramecium bursaria]